MNELKDLDRILTAVPSQGLASVVVVVSAERGIVT